jgi:hypothetical protein
LTEALGDTRGEAAIIEARRRVRIDEERGW